MRSTIGKSLRLPPFEEGFPSIARSKGNAEIRLDRSLGPLEADIPDSGKRAVQEADFEGSAENLDWLVADCSWGRLDWPGDKLVGCRPVEIGSMEECILVDKLGLEG